MTDNPWWTDAYGVLTQITLPQAALLLSLLWALLRILADRRSARPQPDQWLLSERWALHWETRIQALERRLEEWENKVKAPAPFPLAPLERINQLARDLYADLQIGDDVEVETAVDAMERCVALALRMRDGEDAAAPDQPTLEEREAALQSAATPT